MAFDPSIIMGYKGMGEVPNPLAQMAQVSQVQASQRQNEIAQMQLEDLKNDRIEMQKFQAELVANGGNPDLKVLAQTMLRSPKTRGEGIELMQKLNQQAQFETVGKKLYPELFGAEPTAAASVAPAAPEAGSFAADVAARRAAAPVNALMPTAAPTAAAPVNALAAPAAAPTGKTVDQLRREIIMFSQSTDPRAKAMVDMLKNQLTELGKAQTLSPGQQLYAGGKVVYTAPEKDSEFERLLTKSGLSDTDKTALRVARAKKEATHAPGTTVNVSTEKKYGERFGGLIADADAAKLSAAESAPAAAANADRIIDLISTGQIITGTGANVRLQMAKALNLAGGNDSEKIRNTEVLISSLAETTLGAIKSSNLGAGQGFTNADRDFLEKAKAGQLTYDAKSLTELARLSRLAAEKSAESWNTRVKKIPASALEGTGISTEPVVIPPRKVSSVMKIPAGAITDLKSGKGSPEQFDAVFGAGSAKRILGEGK